MPVSVTYSGTTEAFLSAMIYNWKTAQWTEYREMAPIDEADMTTEINCAQVFHENQVKIFVVFKKHNHFTM